MEYRSALMLVLGFVLAGNAQARDWYCTADVFVTKKNEVRTIYVSTEMKDSTAKDGLFGIAFDISDSDDQETYYRFDGRGQYNEFSQEVDTVNKDGFDLKIFLNRVKPADQLDPKKYQAQISLPGSFAKQDTAGAFCWDQSEATR